MSKKSTKKMTPKSLLGLLVMAALLFFGQQLGLLPAEEALPPTEILPITAPQNIADYLFEHGELPDNFITKDEARALGWDNTVNEVSDVAPGKSLGGDRFGNYEGLLPDAKGRTWYEADANYHSGDRGAERIVYSSDGLVYYTPDHYESFIEMHPSR